MRRRLDQWAERFGRRVYERSWGYPPNGCLAPVWARRHFTRFGYQAAALRSVAAAEVGVVVLVVVMVVT